MRGRNHTYLLVALFLGMSMISNAQVPFTCDGRFYMTQVFVSSSALVEVDINPVTEEVVFNTIQGNFPTIINAIGYRAEENLIYGIHPVDHVLYRMDAAGDLEILANLNLTPGNFYLGADITPDGRFLVLVGSADIDGIPVDLELAYVDLDDPNYSVDIVRLSGELVNMLDIAFDPTDDRLYAFDSGGNRLVRILPDGTVEAPFPPSPLLENAGSVFFDVFGDLFAYGSPGGGIQTTLYAVNKNTGEFRILTTGAEARATDACSCPFSVEVRKTVLPEVTIPCGRVQYYFAISNLSSRTQTDLFFEDLLPAGFTISSIVKNPFGGTVQSAVGTDLLQISDLDIPPGVDTIIIEVDLDEIDPGIYKNQALLLGLPPGLGDSRLSDDPRTLAKRDSTSLEVVALGFDSLRQVELVCVGEGVTLDASAYGVTFEWEDGSTDPVRDVERAGDYTVMAISLCDTVEVTYEVAESSIDVSISAFPNDVALGETVVLSSSVFQTGQFVTYDWVDPFDGTSLNCLTCPDPIALPIGDVTYELTVTDENGCTASDSVSITVNTDKTIYAPNVFTPNGDNINDIWFLQGLGNGSIRRLDIYNRWGGLVYSAPSEVLVNDRTTGWDGRIGGEYAEPAVYTWVAELRYLDGVVEIVSGDITLLR